jgi:Macrocin-O-methyltransferase (TylF)
MHLARTKSVLINLGAILNHLFLDRLHLTVEYLLVGEWTRQRGLKRDQCIYSNREQVWEVIAEQVANKRVLYLEFGVWRGVATRWWSAHLRNPASILHGFDSFEGLPEHWRPDAPQGAFDVSGEIPKIDDPRVRFYKGWFNQTLPDYVVPAHEVLVLNMDADIYSSTKYVLDFLESHICPGTFIYFDEFAVREHEMRAFDEFLTKTGLKVRILAADLSLWAVAFEVI